MKHESRIVEAFKSNAITKILLIDDAYDAPALDDATIAALDEFFNEDSGRDLCGELGIEKELFDTAVDAVLEGRTDSEEVESVHQNLYAKFAQGGMAGYDPGGRFELVKGIALAALWPLYALLSKCGENVEVRTSGLEDAMKIYREFRPQVLFVDYYLDEDVPATGDISEAKFAGARRASLIFLRQVIEVADVDDIPAIVLMSSRRVDDVDRYRHEVDTQIMSLRFQFLEKALVKQENRNIVIDHLAADVLLDMSQGYIFGRLLQQALAQWKTGTQSALDVFIRQIGNLDAKDFAYLLRFRLREEGQPLSEYLEWLFGECLKSLIDEKVDWKHASFAGLDGNEKMTGAIEDAFEGAFEGPSAKTAEFFQRVRVNGRRVDARRGYQLGDLYEQIGGRGVRAVITPDCDLVVRRNGKAKVDSILTMGGTLNTFDEEGSTADDFFLRDNMPYSVRWNPKDLRTFPISGKESLHEIGKFRFVGTLRPIYAQEMAALRANGPWACWVTGSASSRDRGGRNCVDTYKERECAVHFDRDQFVQTRDGHSFTGRTAGQTSSPAVSSLCQRANRPAE